MIFMSSRQRVAHKEFQFKTIIVNTNFITCRRMLLLYYHTKQEFKLFFLLTAMTAIPKVNKMKRTNQKVSVHPLTCNGTFLLSELLLKHPPISSYV